MIISQQVAPSAGAASQCSAGAWLNTSREIAEMIGRIITTASTRPTVNIPVRPLAEAGPAKKGKKPQGVGRPLVEGHEHGREDRRSPESVDHTGMAASRSMT